MYVSNFIRVQIYDWKWNIDWFELLKTSGYVLSSAGALAQKANVLHAKQDKNAV